MKNFGATRQIYSYSYAVLFAMSFMFAACDSVSPEDGLEVQSAASNGRATSSKVYQFSDMSETGASTLRRDGNGIALTINTSDLLPGYAYTVWWLTFDKPEFCSPPACGEDDVFEDALAGGPNKMQLSILGAADGSVINGNGRANYKGYLEKNDASTAIFGDGLDYPRTAEVHYVIRSHGPAIPGLIEEQITTFNGGCDPGQPNEGLCEDVQFAVHIAR